MMSPYGAAEKQAMLEAPDLKTRAEILIAVTEMVSRRSVLRAIRGCSNLNAVPRTQRSA
jgi:Lon protease-like protein